MAAVSTGSGVDTVCLLYAQAGRMVAEGCTLGRRYEASHEPQRLTSLQPTQVP